MERLEALKNYYETHNEDIRLESRHGMVEFLTTIHYIQKYLKQNMNILEIGAGTGKYSHIDEMDDNMFEIYMKYHLCICERPDMIGATSHMLDIFRKI